MTEFIFALAIFAFAAGGLGLGLMLGRDPVRTNCGASDRLARGRCADCPLRRRSVGKSQE